MSLVKRLLRQRLVVTLKTGEAFDGVLYEADRQAWVLCNVTLLHGAPKGDHLPVDGEVLILTSDIAYTQKP